MAPTSSLQAKGARGCSACEHLAWQAMSTLVMCRREYVLRDQSIEREESGAWFDNLNVNNVPSSVR